MTAAAMHYYLVSLFLLSSSAPQDGLPRLYSICSDVVGGDMSSREDLQEACALEICGIAFTSNSTSVLVNSFGPICHCSYS